MMLSVVVCTYNREKYLPRGLECLAKQACDKSLYEIILVNNNCTDSTPDICAKFQEDYPDVDFKYFVEEKAGLSHARNRGIQEASGKYVSFIDDDGFSRPDYVEQIIKALDTYTEYTAIGGKVIPEYAAGVEPKWMSKYNEGLVSKVDYGEKIKEFPGHKYPVGCNMAFRAEFFDKYGGFNSDLHARGDDKFIFEKLKNAGLKVLYYPPLSVDHFMDAFRTEKPYLYKQSFQIGESERLRLKGKPFAIIGKFIELSAKYGAALILGTKYLLKGTPIKSYYLLLVRYNVIKGLLNWK